MGFLALKVLCSVGVGLIVRQADHKGVNRLGMIRINYAAAAIIAFLLLIVRPEVKVSRSTLWIALVAGLSYSATMLLWAEAISRDGIARTVGLTRMSVIIPVLASILVWREIPNWHQALGIALGIVALLLTGRKTAPSHKPPAATEGKPGRSLLAICLFLASGVAALSTKLFQKLAPMQDNLHFQALLFVVAFMVVSVFYFRRREGTDRTSIKWGSLLGAVNLGSSILIILALGLVSGTLAFPTSAAAEVAVLAILGRVIWKEPLDRLSVLGLVLTVAALLLVQIR